MKNINPKLFLPILSLFIMVFQEATGLKFDATELQIINDGILAAIALIGVLSSPVKEVAKKKED